jgi:hypothetical protein
VVDSQVGGRCGRLLRLIRISRIYAGPVSPVDAWSALRAITTRRGGHVQVVHCSCTIHALLAAPHNVSRIRPLRTLLPTPRGRGARLPPAPRGGRGLGRIGRNRIACQATARPRFGHEVRQAAPTTRVARC